MKNTITILLSISLTFTRPKISVNTLSDRSILRISLGYCFSQISQFNVVITYCKIVRTRNFSSFLNKIFAVLFDILLLFSSTAARPSSLTAIKKWRETQIRIKSSHSDFCSCEDEKNDKGYEVLHFLDPGFIDN